MLAGLVVTHPATVTGQRAPHAPAPPADAAGAVSDEATLPSRGAGAARRAGRTSRATASGLRVIVSLGERMLVVTDSAGDTLRTARVGVGMDSTLEYQGRVWDFHTPRGRRRVIRKVADPTWAPPDWHYVEMARARGLRLVEIPANRLLKIDDTTGIQVRRGEVGLVRPGTGFTPFAVGEEVIWDGVLYIPPLGTRQRAVAGELGRFRLDIGDGYLLHGTPYPDSIGQPSSHGCIRVGDDDIAWLYANIPVGTPVEIR
ncbi:MAG: ErfK/YbiS/YcfS/YnhG family protein [Gemmatimonadetes bacterium]|nr:ErfK/YbiS/YcfS/YnhG family protein [Gemmatimonadota bacterium]